MTEYEGDLLYLQVGEHDDAFGEVVVRAEIPTDSYQTALSVKLSAVIDDELQDPNRDIEVWIVTR